MDLLVQGSSTGLEIAARTRTFWTSGASHFLPAEEDCPRNVGQSATQRPTSGARNSQSQDIFLCPLKRKGAMYSHWLHNMDLLSFFQEVQGKAHCAGASLEMTPCGKLTLGMNLDNNSSIICLLVISIIHNLFWSTHDKVGCVDPPMFKDALRKQPNINSPPRVHVGPPASFSDFLILGQRGLGGYVWDTTLVGWVRAQLIRPLLDKHGSQSADWHWNVENRKETVGELCNPLFSSHQVFQQKLICPWFADYSTIDI